MASGKPQNPEDVGKSPIFAKIVADWRGGSTVVLTGFLDGPFNPKPKVERVNEPQEAYSDMETKLLTRFRLYPNLDLDDYIEIKWQDIRHIENYTPANGAPADAPILERVTIWVDADAKVDVSSFVIGAIAELYMPLEDAVSGLVKAKRQEENLGRGSVFGCSPRANCTMRVRE